MAGKKRPGNYRELSALAKNILLDVRDDFTAKGLSADTLTEEYDGLSLITLEQKYSESAAATKVDFELALKELEEALFAKTGPMVPYDNPPNSKCVIFAMFSKREYMYLTEAGYRAAAQMNSEKPKSAATHVHISGGTFHQSQIGIGEQITQVQRVDVENDAEVIERLTQLLLEAGTQIDEVSKAELLRLVEVAHQGNGAEAKSVFQKLFGLASDGVKQTGWGIVTTIITKALGM